MRWASISGRASEVTALAQYARLEAPARYFDGVSAAPVPVVVSFGARSLVIMDHDGAARAHWPLARLRAVSARGDRQAQIAPEGESAERLALEDREMIAAVEAVCPRLYAREADRRGGGRAALWGVAALAAVVVMVVAILPALAGQLAALIPPERERQIGTAVVRQVRGLLEATGSGAPGFCSAPAGIAALEGMTLRLEETVVLPYPLAVSVIDHPMVNAFAAPGGRIVLFRGLIETAETPEEVAGVLAHEMGHVLARDPTVGVLRTAGTAGIFGLLVGDVLGASVVVATSELMLNAHYQREAEMRADRTALTILDRAGLPSDPLAGFFARMAREHGDARGVLRYFASHPALDDRAEAAAAADDGREAAFRPVLSDQDWVALGGICRETAEAPRF